jgi:undecaprenyl-diphosphatase
VSDIWYAVLLGIVQGVTEFLPVSSSAHLILARALFGWDGEAFGLAFDVATHVGTLGAIVVYFRSDLLEMLRSVPVVVSGSAGGARRLRLIAVGTIPVVIIGGLLSDWLEATTRTPPVAAFALAVGALLFIAIERRGAKARNTDADLGVGEALVFGVAQSLALIPGVSRSGATITAGMAMGFTREAAARFGFLLGIPAILAAAAKAALDVVSEGVPIDVPVFAVGIFTSFVVGYLTVAFFMRFLGRSSLDVFAVYRLLLAATVLVWLAR